MNAPERPKIEHKPYRKPIPAPGKPAAASKPPPPGKGPPPRKKPRPRPLADEVALIVRNAAAGTPDDQQFELLGNIIKAITKRLHGCHVPAQRRDKVAKRLPDESVYVKRWRKGEWIVDLYVGTEAGGASVAVDPGNSIPFGKLGPGSFLTEQNVDKLYRKWKREQEGKK